MSRSACVIVAFALISCAPQNEFDHQTVAAYLNNEALRVDVLKRCNVHTVSSTPFKTSDDTEECTKAGQAQGQVNYQIYLAKEAAASQATMAKFLGLKSASGSKSSK